MTQIIVGEQESLESALKRFKRAVSKAGILRDAKKNRFFETPIEKKRRKAEAMRGRRRRTTSSG
jgi:small subunit ribosomal protein S21